MLKRLFNPWSVLRDVERDLLKSDESADRAEKAKWRYIQERNEAQEHIHKLKRELFVANAELVTLRAFKARYDQPRIAGKFAPKARLA